MAPPPSLHASPSPAPRRRPRRRRAALAAAVLVLLPGLAASVVASSWWRGQLTDQHRQTFEATAADVEAQISTSLQRAMDLTAITRSNLALNPAMTNPQMQVWSQHLDAGSRYPGSQGFEYIARVPAAELEAYAAVARQDPNPGSTPFDAGAILPSGERAEYCFTRLIELQGDVAQIQNAAPSALTQTDWCSTSLAPSLANATDTGTFAVASGPSIVGAASKMIMEALHLEDTPESRAGQEQWAAATKRSVFVFAPIYRDGSTPATVAERRAASIGWAAAAFDVGHIVDAAVADHPGLQVRLATPESDEPVTAGHAASRGGESFRFAGDMAGVGGWTATIAGALDPGGLSTATQSLLLLLGGLLVALLVSALLAVLFSSRNRALDLVDKRTGELRHQALHDALTGLPNRALVLDRADQMLARARREATDVAVLFIDLDNFKDINDSLGHAAGDELLVAVGNRFQAALRETDTVGRLGGDEFVVVAEGESTMGGADLVAQRLLDVLQEPFLLAGSDTPRTITASIGVASGHAADPQDLLRDADIALYEAKDAGKSCFRVYESGMHDEVDARLRLDAELRSAIEHRELVLFFQPTFGIRDAETTGVEALLRWDHPHRGIVAPGEFLPLLESSGLILQVGRWVLQQACDQGAAWHLAGHRITMSVNASARQVEAGTLATDVRDALEATGFDPAHLVVEITESTLMRDAAGAIAQLNAIKALGVRVAIDDFGTGYSSMAYLRQFPVDILKIDRSFITDLTRSHDSVALVHALIQLGKTLGLETVAEGIEDHDQLHQLQHEDCDTGQGYLVSRPLPAADLTLLLERAAEARTAGV